MEEEKNKTIEEILKEYFIEDIEFIPPEEMVGYRVITVVSDGRVGEIKYFKTDIKAWVEEFKFVLIPDTISNRTMILASPECPEYYVLQPEDVVEFVKKFLKSEGNQNLSDWLDQWQRLRTSAPDLTWDGTGLGGYTYLGSPSNVKFSSTGTSSLGYVSWTGTEDTSSHPTGTIYYNTSSGQLGVKDSSGSIKAFG